MLFLHETHKVVGAREDEFEAAYREGWMPTLATGRQRSAALVHQPRARLRGGLQRRHHHRHRRRRGVGEPGPPDAAAATCSAWMRELDNLRHEVTGKILLPVDWSPLQDVDLTTVPTDGATHPLSLFMEDTGWPYAPLDDYIRSLGRDLLPSAVQGAPRMRMLDIQACFQVAHGSYKRREAMLWQKIDAPTTTRRWCIC